MKPYYTVLITMSHLNIIIMNVLKPKISPLESASITPTSNSHRKLHVSVLVVNSVALLRARTQQNI